MRHFWESARYVSARRNSVFRLPLANRIRTTRCGGTVTVRFRFSFYPRFGGLFFSFSLCFFFFPCTRHVRGNEARETGLRCGLRERGESHHVVTTRDTRGWFAGAICTPLDILRNEILRKSFLSELRNSPSKCVPHNFRDGGDHCRMNILSLQMLRIFSLSLSLFLPEALIYARVNNVVWKISSAAFIYRRV